MLDFLICVYVCLVIFPLTRHRCKWVKDSRNDVKLHNHSLTLTRQLRHQMRNPSIFKIYFRVRTRIRSKIRVMFSVRVRAKGRVRIVAYHSLLSSYLTDYDVF